MIYENALQFAAMDIATIPLMHHDKRPEASLLPMGHWEQYKKTLPSPADLKSWFHTEYQNYGVVTGWNNLVVLDFDDMNQYGRWRDWVSNFTESYIAAKLRYFLKVKTNRGVHVYFRLKHLNKLTNRKFPGLDLKVNGYVVGPGSIHPSGAPYQLLSDLRLLEIDNLSDILPASLLEQTTNAHVIPVIPPPDLALKNLDPWETANNPGSGGDLISAIRARFKIEDFFPQTYKTSLDARWFTARCPFHDDLAPSFWIDSQRGICNCFSCEFTKPLDVIDLYAALYGLDNRAALYALAAKI